MTIKNNDKKKNNITQVGYEIELDSGHYNEGHISKKLGLSFKEFKTIKGYNLLIKMSKEYYSSTIEFNFIKEEFNKNLHNKIKRFTNAMLKQFDLKVYGRSPAFVGTHIHFFRSGLNTIQTDTILKIVMEFILENIKDLHINSVERVICSHQLWGNYAVLNPIIAVILKDSLGKEFQYSSNSINRPKYQPVIHSPRSTTGKLRSTEIRLIPTEFILNDKVLILIDRLKSMSSIPNKDIPTLYTELIIHYKGLLEKSKPKQELQQGEQMI